MYDIIYNVFKEKTVVRIVVKTVKKFDRIQDIL